MHVRIFNCVFPVDVFEIQCTGLYHTRCSLKSISPITGETTTHLVHIPHYLVDNVRRLRLYIFSGINRMILSVEFTMVTSSSLDKILFKTVILTTVVL